MTSSVNPVDEEGMRYFHYNKVYVIESTPNTERLTGKELFNDLFKRVTYQNHWFMCAYQYVETRKQFFRCLSAIRRHVLAGDVYPMVHFEGHGNRTGLEVGKGGNQIIIKWQDIAAELRKINVLTRNNLMVTIASCHGSSIYKGVDPGDRSPFFGFIAPLAEISPSEIAEGFNEFYERIIRTSEFDKAVLALRGGMDGTPVKFTYQHCEAVIQRVLDDLGATMRDPVYRQQKALALTVRSLSNINVRLNNTIPNIVDYFNSYVAQSDEHLKNMQNHFLMKDLQEKTFNNEV